MSTTTTNYGLVKPELTDPADITATNENWNKIDSQLKINNTLATEAKNAASNASGKRVNRLVIATSLSGWTARDCDYLCDGTSDNVEINNAITSLSPNGGEIILLDGTYKVSSPIVISVANVILRGNGASTKITRAFSGTTDNDSMIIASAENSVVRDLSIDGVKTTYSTQYNTSGISIRSAKVTIENCTIQNCATNAIFVNGNYTSDYAIIRGNRLTNNYCGILLSYCNHCNVADNVDINNYVGVSLTRCNYATISGNVVRQNTWRNIGVYWSSYNVIANNNCSVANGDAVIPSEGTIVIQSEGGTVEAVSEHNIVADNVVGIGTVINNGGEGSVIATITNITAGTEDLEAGVSTLKSGEIYLVYE